jgi:hypothetical protein
LSGGPPAARAAVDINLQGDRYEGEGESMHQNGGVQQCVALALHRGRSAFRSARERLVDHGHLFVLEFGVGC